MKKKNKLIQVFINFIIWVIPIGIGSYVNNYLGISNKNFFSFDTALCILIVAIIYVILQCLVLLMKSIFSHFRGNDQKHKSEIILELDKRYFTQNELKDAVVQALKEKGKECGVIDPKFLVVDGKKYYLYGRTVPVEYGPPVQQAILEQMSL